MRHPGPRCRGVRLAVLTLIAIAGVQQVRAQAPVDTFDAAWRIVRDSHFDPAMNGVDWQAVAAELRPAASAARDAGELRAVLRDMLGRLGQSHFSIVPASSDPGSATAGDLSATPGFDIRLVGRDILVTQVDPDSGAATSGVRRGWKVTSVDGTPVAALVGSLAESLEARLLQVEAWRVVHTRLRGPIGTKADVWFVDGAGQPVRHLVERRREAGQPVTVGNLPTMYVRVDARTVDTPGRQRAGVVRFNVWMATVDGLFQRAIDDLRGSDGLVIDLRGNPGGLAAMLSGISGHFIDERKVLGVMRTRDNELRFVANPRRVSATGERVHPYGGPVAILVDSLTGSASECFAGGMQSIGRARVFGQSTMGQALPALFSRLPNGDVLIHAYADFVTADGTRLEGRGVIPDDLVRLEHADLLSGRDRTLEAALAWIDSVGRAKVGQNH